MNKPMIEAKENKGKFVRVITAILAIFACFLGAMTIKEGIEGIGKVDNSESSTVLFNPSAYTEEEQVVFFDMISYSFASFELSDAQGMYFVFDSNMYPYIVCMENDRLETEFAAIYEYTFNDVETAPMTGKLEGYAMEIDDELKTVAIEEFNYLWNEQIVNESNFEDYFGAYYLDSTYIPDASEKSATSNILSGIFILLVGVFLLYYTILGYKKYTNTKKETVASNGIAEAANSTAESNVTWKDIVTEHNNSVTAPIAGELPMPRNIIVSMLATVAGAVLGGLLWILFYKMGRIVAVAGYIAVLGAIWGWTKIGRREMNTVSTFWCMFVGIAMIAFSNYVAYAWDIYDAINASSHNRAEFLKILVKMPQLMTEWELWGSFIGELALGLVLAVIAGISSLFGGKKNNR